MLVMDDDVLEELGRLRARAYGPHADIDDADLERLAQLEALNRTAPDESIDAPDEEPVDAAVVEPQEVEAVEPVADAESGPVARRLTGRTRAMWIASVGIAAAVGAVVTLAVTLPLNPITPAAGGGEVHEVATLSIDPGFVPPKFIDLGEDGDGTHGFEEFYGLTPVFVDAVWGSEAADVCFLIMETAEIDVESDSFSGYMTSGCGAGQFPATIELRVNVLMPDELRAEFPDGSALQFVLDGSRIGVFSDAE